MFFRSSTALSILFSRIIWEKVFPISIALSLKKEYASENGTELNSILPKMSPLNPNYLTKKHTVFQKITALVEKFKGVGGNILE